MFLEKEYSLLKGMDNLDSLINTLNKKGFIYELKNGEHLFLKDGKKHPNKLSEFKTAIKLIFDDQKLYITLYIEENIKLLSKKSKYYYLIMDTCYSVLNQTGDKQDEWDNYYREEKNAYLLSIILVVLICIIGFVIGYYSFT